VSAKEEIIDLKFKEIPDSGSETFSDAFRTLKSLIKIQGTSGLLQDGLYLMTHYGDREKILSRRKPDPN
jgi:hypothetical protein